LATPRGIREVAVSTPTVNASASNVPPFRDYV